MKHYRPLLVSDLDLQVIGLQVSGFRLNSHTPESQVGQHRHEHDQIVVCLKGRCHLKIGGRSRGGRPGAVFVIPGGVEHGFLPSPKAAPLCLVIDLQFPDDRQPDQPRADLPVPDLTAVKARISGLFRLDRIEGEALRLPVIAVLCDILDPVLKAVGWIQRAPGSRHAIGPQPVARMLDRILTRPGGDRMDVAQIAERMGYQQDHLNRRLKAETGLTIGQYRSRLRLKKAQQLLMAGRTVQETAEMAGFPDKNYFSRWFRQQAGITATAWRKENAAIPIESEPFGYSRGQERPAGNVEKRDDDLALSSGDPFS